MTRFQDAPAHAELFPRAKERSPGARVLAAAMSGRTIEPLIATGWLDPEALAEDVDGIPALGCFLANVHAASLDGYRDHLYLGDGTPWPAGPDGDWSQVALDKSATQSPRHLESARSQWVAGWCLAHAPHGLMQATWAPPVDPDAVPAPPPPAADIGLLSWCVAHNWGAAADLVLRRPDAPDARQVQALRAPIEVAGYVWEPGAGEGEEEALVLRRHRPPLLHLALAQGNLELARRLLRHGLDPHQPDDSGIPAWYYATGMKALEMLLENGMDPVRVNECPLPPSALWAGNHWAGNVPAALEAIQQWQARAMSQDQLVAQVLPAVARSMDTSTLADLKARLKGMGSIATRQWTQDGRPWTLSTRALVRTLNQSDPSAPAAARAWCLSRGSLAAQPDVIEGVSNLDALWWLGQQWEPARKLWEASVPDPAATPDTDPGTRAWVEALLRTAAAPPPHLPEFASPLARTRLLKWAWRGLAAWRIRPVSGSQDALVREAANAMLAVPPLSREQAGTDALLVKRREPLADLVGRHAFSRVSQLAQQGDLALSGEWLDIGLRSWMARDNLAALTGGMSSPTSGERFAQALSGNLPPDALFDESRQLVGQCQAIRHAMSAGVVLPADGQALAGIQATTERWRRDATLAQIVPLLDGLRIHTRLPASQAQARPTRRM